MPGPRTGHGDAPVSDAGWEPWTRGRAGSASIRRVHEVQGTGTPLHAAGKHPCKTCPHAAAGRRPEVAK